MYGEVQVPYTNIGGSNMRSAAALYNLSGSTEEPAIDEETATTIGVRWSLPGGIVNGGSGGYSFWGYAIYSRLSGAKFTYDTDVENWLKGDYRSGYTPRREVTKDGGPFTRDAIEAGGPEIIDAVNNMVKVYVNNLAQPGTSEDYNTFKAAFVNCIYLA